MATSTKTIKLTKAPKEPKKLKLSKMELFKKLGDYDENTKTTRFVNKDEFIGEYALLFFKNGELVDKHIGNAPKAALVSKLEAQLN